MVIETKYHGKVTVQAEEVIAFPEGLPGFPEEKSFVVLPFSAESPFFILQSTNRPALAFVTADPFLFFEDYSFSLSEAARLILEMEDAHQAAVYVILTLREPFQESTANLKAPVVINHQRGKGKQLILNDCDYSMKQVLTERHAGSGKRGDHQCSS